MLTLIDVQETLIDVRLLRKNDYYF